MSDLQGELYQSGEEIKASGVLEKGDTTAEVIVAEQDLQPEGEKGGQDATNNSNVEKEETGENNQKKKKKKNKNKNKNQNEGEGTKEPQEEEIAKE